MKRKNKWDYSWKTAAVLAFMNYLFGIVNTYFFIKDALVGELFPLGIFDAIVAPLGFIAGTMAVITVGKKLRYIR